jgi:hypothetical protein
LSWSFWSRLGCRPNIGWQENMSSCPITFICSAPRQWVEDMGWLAGLVVGKALSAEIGHMPSISRFGNEASGIAKCGAVQTTTRNGLMCGKSQASRTRRECRFMAVPR